MDQLPVFFDLKDRWVAVIGGGPQAARRAELALRAGARVRVFAATLGGDFETVIRHPDRIAHVPRLPAAADLEGVTLVFCADGDKACNAAGRDLAKAARIPCNVVDTPEWCDFTMPSIVDRSPVVIAISTAGTSPILGRMIKARIETMLPAAYGRIAQFVGRFRRKVTVAIKSFDGRRHFWERILEGPVVDRVLAGRDAEAAAEFEVELAAAAAGIARSRTGEVYLVGAGPGDPDLVTFKALRLMQRADVVLYDRLVGDGILGLVRREAERIYVGKLPTEHTASQDEIGAMLVRLAQEGKRVLRLKGGDPFLFGRGGEEIERLAGAGIPFQVVPGVTAALGCAAYAGIPLTHRDHAGACVFVTGHSREGKVDLDWTALVRPRQTVAVYMGLSHLAEIARGFVDHGADPALPVAVVDGGTRPEQQVVIGNLADIAQRSEAAALKGPAILIVGTVVRLHETLGWNATGSQTS
ncbi:MAG: uroporphyrinogen-III C-methyltransferase [Alphaproteobacteria bacterium]|nr:uroporphyrinogen-III C-methyltransferase [Alphaproteobacteria bacterium]